MDLTPANIAAWKARASEQYRQHHIAIARKARADVEQRQGSLPCLTVVDGRRGVDETSVKPGGNITYLFDPVSSAVVWTLAYLRAFSPVDQSPKADDRVFKDSFALLAAGLEIPASELPSQPFGTTITIINRRFGYSRLLEHGWSLQAPNGVMQVVAKAASSTWRRLVAVNYTWIAVEEDMTDNRKRDRVRKNYRYPVIELTALQA